MTWILTSTQTWLNSLNACCELFKKFHHFTTQYFSMLHDVSICLHKPVTEVKDSPSTDFAQLRHGFLAEIILLGELQMKFPSVWVDPGTTSSWLQSKEGFKHLIRHLSAPSCFILESCNIFWQANKVNTNVYGFQ